MVVLELTVLDLENGLAGGVFDGGDENLQSGQGSTTTMEPTVGVCSWGVPTPLMTSARTQTLVGKSREACWA